MLMRAYVKGLLLLVSVFMFAGASAPAAEAQAAKIGFVDLQRVVVESKKGQDLLAKLRSGREGKQKEVDAEEEKIRKMEGDLEKQRSVLSEAARKDREKAVLDRARELRRKVEDLNREFGEKERELQNQLIREIAGVVATYGEKNGYLLIMERRAGGVMYGNPTADVTKEVIAAYDGQK